MVRCPFSTFGTPEEAAHPARVATPPPDSPQPSRRALSCPPGRCRAAWALDDDEVGITRIMTDGPRDTSSLWQGLAEKRSTPAPRLWHRCQRRSLADDPRR